MKMANPKNFKPFIDPDGGQWIEVTGASKYKGVIWRPVDIELTDDEDENGGGNLKFECEFLTVAGTESMYLHDEGFQKLAGQVILDIIEETVKQSNPLV